MADLWLPEWESAPYDGLGGGTYIDLDNPKLLWHTWEGDSWSSAESLNGWAHYPPHAAAHRGDRKVRQYVPLNRSAYSLAGTAAEHEFVIQVEVNGRAAETEDWSDADYDWLKSAVLEPIERAVGVPRIVIPAGFHGEGEGFVLATPRSKIRLASVAALRAFSGHLGHQHAPAPDAHWDPGRFRIDYLLREDDMALADLETKIDDIWKIITATDAYKFPGTDKGADVHWAAGFAASNSDKALAKLDEVLSRLKSTAVAAGSSLSDADVTRIVKAVIAEIAS